MKIYQSDSAISRWPQVIMGGQDLVISRTGYTNELGREFYAEPHHNANSLRAHLQRAGEPLSMQIFGLDSMQIRRIEAGILNAGSDFDYTTTSFDVGLGMFVGMHKADFKAGLHCRSARRKPD